MDHYETKVLLPAAARETCGTCEGRGIVFLIGRGRYKFRPGGKPNVSSMVCPTCGGAKTVPGGVAAGGYGTK